MIQQRSYFLVILLVLALILTLTALIVAFTPPEFGQPNAWRSFKAMTAFNSNPAVEPM